MRIWAAARWVASFLAAAVADLLPAWPSLALFLAASLAGSSANAGGLNPELGIGVNGMLVLGDLASVSKFGYGGDVTLNLAHVGGGLGLRVAGGLVLLQDDEIPTGEELISPYGTSKGSFIAKTNVVWLAVGPEWSAPVGKGRIDYYLMVGKATVNSTSAGTYFNVAGPDAGTTHTSLVLGGAMWSIPRGRAELGAEFFASGSAALWDDPPIVSDGAGGFVTQAHTAPVTGVAVRLAVHFGRGARRV